MSIVSNNIKFLRKKEHLTQEQLAHKIGIKRSLVGAYEEGRADPRLNNLLKISVLFKVSVDTLISRDLSSNMDNDWENEVKTRILSITVDKEGEENIELIPQKASAGYLNGYADPEYLEELPKFKLPFLQGTGTFRAFELTGDSMLPLEQGTIIIGKYLESVRELKDNRTYVLLTSSEGIVYKRVRTSRLSDGKILLTSDNKNYTPYPVAGEDILEIWEAVMYISKNFPGGGNPEKTDIEELKNMVLGLQQEVIKLKKT
ncbi:MAG: LexA family transcriptional regulator [Cyclobacteriaceae bacterium]|nr:LexA family transcriptional regulator [Cyclobacteriaceae bacterium]